MGGAIKSLVFWDIYGFLMGISAHSLFLHLKHEEEKGNWLLIGLVTDLKIPLKMPKYLWQGFCGGTHCISKGPKWKNV